MTSIPRIGTDVARLDLDGLTKRYGAQAAVDGLTLSAAPGECIALLGPSGCGKTTTLRMAAGFVAPDGGDIRLDGRSIARDPPHRRPIGMVFQAYALFPHMSAAGNVAFGLEMRNLPRAERGRRTAEALALVGLSGMADRYPSQMSGGQQQRVALARALVIEPELLLLDEPLSNLDATLRGEMRAEISRLRARLPVTTLFVTHDQSEAMALADRIAVLDKGQLVEVSDPRTLSEAPTRLFTARFLGERTVLPGAVRDGTFDLGTGLSARITSGAPARPTHLALRAARLRFGTEGEDAPLRLPGRVAEAAWLGDTVSYQVQTAGPRLAVIRPTTEAPLPPGAEVTVIAGPDAMAWIAEPQTEQDLAA
ncbi:ABC transporter ATP-binding protein [Roseomonas sp. CCTCC AB2023176]|uniref:ABC transporter ATP-binding protein n=1 Tax=Roseomonas sp. CCTCC AB2023176 TaxID=3342640 RepID=UPI0035D62390